MGRPAGAKNVTPDEVDEIRRLYRAGVKIDDIVEQVGRSTSVVERAVRDATAEAVDKGLGGIHPVRPQGDQHGMQLQIFGSGIHPETGERVAFSLDDRYQQLRRTGPAHVLGNLRTAAEAVGNPLRKFKDLKRPGMRDAYAYLTKPEHMYVDAEKLARAPQGSVFVTYFDRAMCIFHADWVQLQTTGGDVDLAEDIFVKQNFGQEI